MDFKYKQTVEIVRKQNGITVAYYPAKVLAAIGKNRYIVEYVNRLTEDKTRSVAAVIDSSDIRLSPPTIEVKSFKEFDRVDAYVQGGWWVGRIARKVDPNYYVILDKDGTEVHSWFYNVRWHLDMIDGNWVYSKYKKDKSKGSYSHRDGVAGASRM